MRIAIGNLGGLTHALRVSLEDLDFDVTSPTLNIRQLLEIGKNYATSSMCYPLKIALGNFVSVRDPQPEVVIFYSGCDLCNLPPANHLIKEILNDQEWYPDICFCAVDSKQNFIHSYFNLLRKLSDKPLHRLIMSMYLGAVKYESFQFMDQVFYNIRPVFSDKNECEKLYKKYLSEITELSSVSGLKNLNTELGELYKNYIAGKENQFLRIGLIGDSYSLLEPSSHNYIDKQLGNLNIIVDRWSYNYLLPREILKNRNMPAGLSSIIRKELGVYTSLEIRKISKYINSGYDGLVFISPFNCNPNEILRNLLTKCRDEFNIPILDLLLDEHNSDIGINTRIEAFVDLLNRKKHSHKRAGNYPVTVRKFSILQFLCDPLY